MYSIFKKTDCQGKFYSIDQKEREDLKRYE
jgi:hypothetical protein